MNMTFTQATSELFEEVLGRWELKIGFRTFTVDESNGVRTLRYYRGATIVDTLALTAKTLAGALLEAEDYAVDVLAGV